MTTRTNHIIENCEAIVVFVKQMLTFNDISNFMQNVCIFLQLILQILLVESLFVTKIVISLKKVAFI